MRGPAQIPKRAGARPRPVNEADARQTMRPAPYGGWNARGNLANMPPLDAVQMDNFFPGVQDVSLRRGSVSWATGIPSNIRSLIPYQSATANKLFASTGSAIYDVTSSGAVGAAVGTCTNGNWISVNMTTSGGSYLSMVNGVDNLRLYDGAAWVTVTGVSVPAITGLATTSLAYVTLHKRRQWFIEVDSMDLWYLPVDSIAGALTQFPLGPLFKKGGKLAAIGSWTLDSGRGSDDYFVAVTTGGEMAVYQGTDPSSSTTWALVGVYDVSPPVGNKPLADFGGDLLYISRAGLFPISKLVQSTLLDASASISFKIDNAFLVATENYNPNFGWTALHFSAANMLLVNIPVSTDSVSYQFVMNTITKSWCRFLSWDAMCWAMLDNELYYAGGTTMRKAWTGQDDAGAPITGTVAQAYQNFGMPGQHQIELVKPNFGATSSATVQMAFDADFKTFGGNSTLTYSPITVGAIWGTSLWGTGVWGSGVSSVEAKWLTVPNDLGDLHSFRLSVTTSLSEFTWTSNEYALRPAGIL